LKTISSLFLWIVGLLFFLLLFIILATGLLLFSSKKIYPLARILTRIQLLIMGVPVKVIGMEKFDHSKSYIIMGNHESLFDVFAIPTAIPMHIVGVEAAYHFSWPLWGWLTKKWGNIPITRHDLPKAIKSLEKARKVVESGTSIVLLPEGHRTLSGEVGEFKKGPFHLAMEAKTDILPFAMSGLFEFKSKYGRTLNPRTVHVIFGKPITYESFKDQSIDEIREKVRNTIVAIKQQSKMHFRKNL